MAPKKRKIVSVKKVVRETVQVAVLETENSQLLNQFTAVEEELVTNKKTTTKSVPVEPPTTQNDADRARTTTKLRKKRKQRGTGKEEYRRYVFGVLKQVHPGMGISAAAMTVVNGMMNDMFERLAEEAGRLSAYTRRATLTAREIQAAVKLVLPGDLATHAVAEGAKALASYVAKVKANV